MFLLILLIPLFACSILNDKQPERISKDLSKNYDLDNNDNFSPDDLWLCYDTRTDGGIGECSTIEAINLKTGEEKTLYKTQNATHYGPGVGAVSFSPIENKVVFIHGLLNCEKNNPYAQWRRTGVLVDFEKPNVPIFMDARDVTDPYTPGALRGGTHRHEWSGDGEWIGYTYNDAIMKELEDNTGEPWNLRTIGVSIKIHNVTVDADAKGENNNGEWFSAIVVKVLPFPKPGSDEISRAADDSWVGEKGYQKPDGTWQRARAFLGVVKNSKGEDVKDLFIVDIPDQIHIPGINGALEGTNTTFPAPPKGTVQRRLTFTADSLYPGCSTVVRSSYDGKNIAYLATDQDSTIQVFFMSPMGGVPVQITSHKTDVQSGIRWHPNGNYVCYVQNNSIKLLDVRDVQNIGEPITLTKPSRQLPSNLVWSHNGRTIAYNQSVLNPKTQKKSKQIFVLNIEKMM